MTSRKALLTCSLLLLSLMTTFARAEVSMNAIRLTAPDTEALAGFYKSVMGMHEVQRVPLPMGMEIMLNFGATKDAAMANRGAQLVMFPRGENEPTDTTAHLVLTVTDMDETVAAIKAGGGSMERDPFNFGDSGIMIATAIDPAGNHFELLYFPAGQ